MNQLSRSALTASQVFRLRSAQVQAVFSVKPIAIVEPATDKDADDAIAGLLPLLSEAASSANPHLEITKVLQEQTVDRSLSQAEIFLDGRHDISDTIAIVAGRATVRARGKGKVISLGHSSVYAHDSVQLWATDNSRANTYDRARIDASGEAVINAYGKTTGTARDRVEGRLHGNSNLTISGKSVFLGFESANATVSGDAVFRAYDRVQVHGSQNAVISLHDDANGWLRDLVKAEFFGQSLGYVASSVNVLRKGLETRVLELVD